MSCILRKFMFVASLIAIPGCAAFAAQPPSLWNGVVRTEAAGATRVLATIDGDKVSLRFGEPANCTIVAELLEVGKDATVYRFSIPKNGGGFCARLYPGDLSIAHVTGTSIDVAFHRQKISWSGMLHRVVDP